MTRGGHKYYHQTATSQQFVAPNSNAEDAPKRVVEAEEAEANKVADVDDGKKKGGQ